MKYLIRFNIIICPIKDIQKNNKTILFSEYPFFSNAWWIGAKEKNLFLYNLKYATCNITDNVSNTNTIPENISNISIFFTKNIEAKNAPKNSDPLSPINIFALFKLKYIYGKNVKKNILQIIHKNKFKLDKFINNNTINEIILINPWLIANPSIPSVRLTAWDVEIITNAAHNGYKKPTFILKNPRFIFE